MATTAFILAAALLAGQSAAQVPAPAPADRIVTASGYVAGIDQEAVSWFQIYDLDARLVLPAAQRQTYLEVLLASVQTSVAVRVRFDAGAGRLGGGGTYIVYPLCSIGTDSGARFGDEERNCPPTAASAPASERLLALGLGQVQQRPGAGRELLTQALAAAPDLPAPARALAHRARGGALEALAFDESESESAGADRLMAESLADLRRVAALRPDDAEAQLAVARALLFLGGYSEARAIYADAARRWPEQAFEIAVRMGALYRQQGDYPRALQELDDYARGEGGVVEGMKFHYHRAWTLSLLERYEEALRTIESGLSAQPDYSSAYQLRSCIRGRLGRVREALADQERALELVSALPGEQTPGVRRIIERSRTIAVALRGAVAGRPTEATAVACEGLWDRWIRPRSRSPLIDAALGSSD